MGDGSSAPEMAQPEGGNQMSRTLDITCDQCGYSDGADGATSWILLKLGKAKHDLCGVRCFKQWVAKLPEQGELPSS